MALTGIQIPGVVPNVSDMAELEFCTTRRPTSPCYKLSPGFLESSQRLDGPLGGPPASATLRVEAERSMRTRLDRVQVACEALVWLRAFECLEDMRGEG